MIRESVVFLLVFCPLAHALIQEKVILCGVCKDVEESLPHSIKIMERIGSMFNDYRVVVYENNSRDSTKEILRKWARKNDRVSVTLENLSRKSIQSAAINYVEDGAALSPKALAWYSSVKCIPGFPMLPSSMREWCDSILRRRGWKVFRIELIARARNIVLDQVMLDEYKDFTYVLWMDMDFKVSPSFEGIAEAFDTDQEWDAVFAYGVHLKDKYRDWYAFRDFHHHPLGPELLGYSWWSIQRTFRLSGADSWYPVSSAFGGFGIYKKSSLLGSRYSAVVNEDLETVSKSIIDQGLKDENPSILAYRDSLKYLRDVVKVDETRVNLKEIYEEDIGIVLNDHPDRLVWRLHSHTYRYPPVCEHVALHASMIARGYDKLFINPRMLFFYEEP